MSDPAAAHNAPIAVEVKAGETYWWCACGKSATQPFCDGSHAGSAIIPLEYVATADRTVYFCACKKTARKPLCDGAHNRT